MAKKSTTTTVRTKILKPKKKRPGVHSKKKNSSNPRSKNYRKKYKSQGR